MPLRLRSVCYIKRTDNTQPHRSAVWRNAAYRFLNINYLTAIIIKFFPQPKLVANKNFTAILCLFKKSNRLSDRCIKLLALLSNWADEYKRIKTLIKGLKICFRQIAYQKLRQAAEFALSFVLTYPIQFCFSALFADIANFLNKINFFLQKTLFQNYMHICAYEESYIFLFPSG